MRDKPYCNAPWLGLYYEGTVGCRPCCEWKGDTFEGNIAEYKESEYLHKFKKMMYDDKESIFCRECIHNEKVGGHSRREYYDRWQCCSDEDMPFDIDVDGLYQIIRLDYRAGNKCNMMCRMCGPTSSSLLEEEIIQAGEQEVEFVKHIDTTDVYSLDLSACEEISILGGEPSIDLKVRKFMNYVAEKYPKVKCVVTTNGTNASKKWFDTLMKFCDGAGLQIILSVDGTGPTQEFQRKSNINWHVIKNNLEKYRKASESHPGCHISIQLTCSAINLVTIDKWWDELVHCHIKIDPNQVWWPKGMAVACIPTELKHKSIDWLRNWSSNYKPDPMLTDAEVKDIYKAVTTIINILENTKFTGTDEFIKTQNRYDGYRDENIIDLDERFKVMMNEG